MHKMLVVVLMTFGLSGCAVPAWTPPPPQDTIPIETTGVLYPNPVFIPIPDPQCAWEAVVDVIDDYFKIEKEMPVRQIGSTGNEGWIDAGRIETFYQVSPTILEPWRRDTAGEYERLENTLQTIRRRAVVSMLPAQGGFWVDVAVFKELEDLHKPEHASAGGATFRYDSSLTRVVNPGGGVDLSDCWIPQGRDPVLEQRIIGHLIFNCNELGFTVQSKGIAPAIQGPAL
jgi:hypothetical protein